MTLLDHKIPCRPLSENKSARTSLKCPKNRKWEKRQKGYKATWLQIDNVARVQKSRIRRELQNSIDWRDLSPTEQQERERIAFSRIEKQREEKREKAKVLYLETIGMKHLL